MSREVLDVCNQLMIESEAELVKSKDLSSEQRILIHASLVGRHFAIARVLNAIGVVPAFIISEQLQKQLTNNAGLLHSTRQASTPEQD